ncbi:unnamed protein product [Closterium sp. NIES-54]
MATPSVLTFDAEGRAVDLKVWVDDLQLFLQCDRAHGLSLFDLTSGASPAPPATANSTVRSQWATRDAAARLAVRRHLPTTERAHFSQYRSAQTLYDAVVAQYSSPATAALSRFFLPYLFPDLTAFPIVTDLITHLRTSDTRYRAALPAEFCAKNPPPHWATRDAAARLAVRRHLPTTERAHFSQYRSAQTLYDAVVAQYSSPATAALSRFFLPYLFPDLTAFPIVTDLITHLRTSDTRYRAALPAEFCAKNPPPHRETPSRQGQGAVEVAVGLAGAVEVVVVEAVEGAGVVVGVVAGVEASVAAVEAAEAEVAEAAVALVAALRRGVVPMVVRARSSSALARPLPPSSFVTGTLVVSGVGVLVPAPTFYVPATVLVSSAGACTPLSAASTA